MEVRSFVRMNQVPDADAIKMFVGQIPYSWNENDIRMYFGKFGGIYCIDIVRDKANKLSKGCCFLTYFSRKCALEAQCACHNIVKLQGMNHPMQMRPADKESVYERRISIEMLSKKLNEMDICQMFGRFGLIEDCFLLRDQNGSSLGCAYITYSSKCSALNSIKEMHQSIIMEGCPFPLLVKMAEGNVDIASVSPSVLNTMSDPSDHSNSNNRYTLRSQPAPQCAQQNQNGSQNGNFGRSTSTQFRPPATGHSTGNCGGNTILNTMNVIPLPTTSCPTVQPNLTYMMQQNSRRTPQNSGAPPSNPVYPLGTVPSNCNARPNYFQSHSNIIRPNLPTNNMNGLPMPPSGHSPNPNLNQNVPMFSYSSSGGIPPHSQGNYQQNVMHNVMSNNHCQSQNHPGSNVHGNLGITNQKVPIGRQEGSTLFVYDLPPEYKEVELSHVFSRFGKVLSTKVFVDKDTNRSKCFGFVSFDNPMSAQESIQAMNGLQMGSRRLQVRIKKPKDKI